MTEQIIIIIIIRVITIIIIIIRVDITNVIVKLEINALWMGFAIQKM